jgi:hypothetical protein
MDHSLLLALSVAGNKLSTDSVDTAAAASAALMVCSCINSAAASGYRPSDIWLQQAWQLLQHALGIAAGTAAMTGALSEELVGAAYATAVKFGFFSTELSDVMRRDIGHPPAAEEDDFGYVTGYLYEDSWLQWLRVLQTPNVLVSGEPGEHELLVQLARFYQDSREPSFVLAFAIQHDSPQLQAEGLLVLSTPAMIEAMFSRDGDGCVDRLPSRSACAELLGALAAGLSAPGDASSSSSSSSGNSSTMRGGALSEVSTDVLLQLAAAMPVLLRSIATVITPAPYAWDLSHTGANGYGYSTQMMLETAGKIVALAQRIAAYTSGISPAHASTAQLVQLDQTLNVLESAVHCLITAWGYGFYRSELSTVVKHHHHHVTNQAIASMPSTPRPTGAEGRGSTAPECLQVLRTSQACTRYLAICIDTN